MKNEIKRTQREDFAARVTRTVRDQAWRATGQNPNDEQYLAIKWALACVREEIRAQG